MRFKKELQIGVYFVVSILALYWGVNFLKGRDVFGKVTSLHAVYENVEGLQSTSLVYMKGLKIGTVKAIKFDAEKQVFDVELQIKSSYKIPNNSSAHLYSADIMSNKAIRIQVGNSEYHFQNGDYIESDVDTDMAEMLKGELKPLKNKVDTLLTELNATFKSINTVLDEKASKELNEGIHSLSRTMANLESITDDFNKSKGSITNSLKNVEDITSNFKKNSDKIDNIVSNFSDLSDSLKSLELNRALASIQGILDDVKNGNGNINKIIYDDALYNELSSSLGNLDLLLEDFRKNPKRYINVSVFGGKDKSEKQAEKAAKKQAKEDKKTAELEAKQAKVAVE